MKTLVAPDTTVTPQKVRWLEIGLQLAFNVSALQLSHVITIHVWRMMTGH
jgi:hypothetical protein